MVIAGTLTIEQKPQVLIQRVLTVTSHRSTCHTELFASFSLRKVLRGVCVTLFCLGYLITNTAVVPSLSVRSGCRCAENQNSNSRCCCVNKSRTVSEMEQGTCCTRPMASNRSCCSAGADKESPGEKSKPTVCQVSRICGCGDSQLKGWYVSDPRQLNLAPRIISDNTRLDSLLVADDTITSLSQQPEIPPPRA